MSRELIYRDEAIKALGEEPPVWNDEYHEIAEREQWRSDVKAIEAVPSAQPDLQPTCNQLATDCISRQDAIDAIVKCTNCNTLKDLREYVAEHGLWSLWSGGVLEALDAVEALPSAPLYTPDELQTMQELEWAQMEKMYEIGKAERKKGKWIPHEGGKFVGFPYMHYECSECRAFEPTETNFCPNCGADMREGDAE